MSAVCHIKYQTGICFKLPIYSGDKDKGCEIHLGCRRNVEVTEMKCEVRLDFPEVDDGEVGDEGGGGGVGVLGGQGRHGQPGQQGPLCQ